MKTNNVVRNALYAAVLLTIAMPFAGALKAPEPGETGIMVDGAGDVGILVGAAGPVIGIVVGAASGEASCTANPCANAKCATNKASAHAVGDEWAYADAAVGAVQSHSDAPGSAHASAAGTGASSASAKGKKDWSLDEANANCGTGSSSTSSMTVQGDAGASDALLANGAGSVACTANAAITATQSFLGQVYVAADGALFAHDAALGLALPLPSLDVAFDGTTFASLVAVDVDGMTPTHILVGAELSTGPEGPACTATLLV